MKWLVPLVALPLLSSCSSSTGSLEDRAEGLPGVVGIEVVEEDVADGDIPFSTTPRYVTARMDADASSDEVMAVLDAYDEAIDDGDVGMVDVVLEGSKQATLSTGEGVHATDEMVADLVASQQDSQVVEYRREAYPGFPSVHIALAEGDFAEVVATADGRPALESPGIVTVVSGEFVLVRDDVNEDLVLTGAREKLVLEIARRFPLRGALVSGRGPVRLAVSPADEKVVRRFVERSPWARGVGKVVVGQSAEPPV